MTNQLPPRRAKGLSLSYEDGDLFVSSFGYSASLTCAANEGVLHHDRRGFEKELSPAQQQVVDEWMDHFDDYFDQNGWPTWDDVHNQPASQ